MIKRPHLKMFCRIYIQGSSIHGRLPVRSANLEGFENCLRYVHAASAERFGGCAGTAHRSDERSIRLGNADVLNGTLLLDRQPSATLEVVIATNPGKRLVNTV
jgi:hypothetical protein